MNAFKDHQIGAISIKDFKTHISKLSRESTFTIGLIIQIQRDEVPYAFGVCSLPGLHSLHF